MVNPRNMDREKASYIRSSLFLVNGRVCIVYNVTDRAENKIKIPMLVINSYDTKFCEISHILTILILSVKRYF